MDDLTNMNKMPETKLVHCNTCGRMTKHYVVATRVQNGSEVLADCNGVTISWQTTYRMLECCGCETVKLHKHFWFSEADEDEDEYYPANVSRKVPDWHDSLPKNIEPLLLEIYTALQANSCRLAMMGARAIIDMVMLDKIGDIGPFVTKLQALADAGIIGKKNQEFLAAAFDAGSATIHRGFEPKGTIVSHVMDIVENLLQTTYVLGSAADTLKEVTPPRHNKLKP